jgi:hypothetical protein
MNSKHLFWWEDGYDANEQQDLNNPRSRIRYDALGENYLCHSFKTDLNHLHGSFFHNDNKFVIINEPGRGKHKKHASASFYVINEKQIVPDHSFEINDNSGYVSVSWDDKLIAIGVLKEDTVMIFEIDSCDLLINLRGGNKLGFWGQLCFLPGNHNNNLFEARAISMDKGRPKETVLRMWDLGFRPQSNDDDDDEEEKKLWQIIRKGAIQYGTTTNDASYMLICTSELTKKIEWIDMNDGSLRRTITSDKWVAKSIISHNNKYLAVSHFGHCCIYDIIQGCVISIINCPDNTANYPVIPIAFINNDKWLLLRINQERSIMICDWKCGNECIVYIRGVGSTISDNCIDISYNELYLISWPYGNIELYDFNEMKLLLRLKINYLLKWQLIYIRYFLEQKRTTMLKYNHSTSNNNNEDTIIQNEINFNFYKILDKIMHFENKHIFCMIVQFI